MCFQIKLKTDSHVTRLGYRPVHVTILIMFAVWHTLNMLVVVSSEVIVIDEFEMQVLIKSCYL